MADEPRRFYITRDKQMVEHGNEDAAILVHVEGQEIDDAQMEAFAPGLGAKIRRALSGKTEAKAVEGPPENKAVGKSESK